MSTWMVVEDEPDLYDTLLALFEIWSIDGVAFTNGTDAIKWIEDVDQGNTDTNIPELALLDIRLPGVTGPEIGQRLRQSPVLNDIAIVLMTAFHLTPQEEETFVKQAKSNNLLYKPLPAPVEFRSILQQAIDSQNQTKLQKTTESPKPAKAPKTADAQEPPAG